METYYPELVSGTSSVLRFNELPTYDTDEHFGDIIYIVYEDAYYFGTADGWFGLGSFGPTGDTGGTGGSGSIGYSGESGGSGGTGYTGATGGADTTCCFVHHLAETPDYTREAYFTTLSWTDVQHNHDTDFYSINVFDSAGFAVTIENSQVLYKTSKSYRLKDLQGFINRGKVFTTKALCLSTPIPYHKEEHTCGEEWIVDVDSRVLDIPNVEIYFYSIFGEELEPIDITSIGKYQIRVTFKECYCGYTFIWADVDIDKSVDSYRIIEGEQEKQMIVDSPLFQWNFLHNLHVDDPDVDLEIEVLDNKGNIIPRLVDYKGNPVIDINPEIVMWDNKLDFWRAKGLSPDSSEDPPPSSPICDRFSTMNYNNPTAYQCTTRPDVVPPFNKQDFAMGDLTVPALKAPFNNYKNGCVDIFDNQTGYVIKGNVPNKLTLQFFRFENESLIVPMVQCGSCKVKHTYIRDVHTIADCKDKNEHIHVHNVNSSMWNIYHGLGTKSLRINIDIEDDCHYLIRHIDSNRLKVYFYKYDNEFLAYEDVDMSLERGLPANVTLVRRSGHAKIFRPSKLNSWTRNLLLRLFLSLGEFYNIHNTFLFCLTMRGGSTV